jgi:hypothetical protein
MRRSMGPEYRTLRQEITSVFRTGARKSRTSYMCPSVSPQKTERQQVCGGLWIAGLDGGQDAGDLVHEIKIIAGRTMGNHGAVNALTLITLHRSS